MLAGVTATAFALRVSQIHQGLFGDELFTYAWAGGRHLHAGNADNPPLYFVLAWLSARLGDPAVSIRLPSLLLGTATVPLVFAFGRRTFGAFPGLIGALFVALDPFAVYCAWRRGRTRPWCSSSRSRPSRSCARPIRTLPVGGPCTRWRRQLRPTPTSRRSS